MAQDNISNNSQSGNTVVMNHSHSNYSHNHKHHSQPFSSSSTPSNIPQFSFPAVGKPLSQKAIELISDNLRDETKPTGVYTIRGVTYLEGKFHEDLLNTGKKCEIFVESEDEWCSGEIIGCHLIPIPHTEIINKLYDIKYTPINSSEEKTENKVKSDKIRLIRPTIVQESTGLGSWQTVSTRIINEEEEYEKEKQRELEEEKEREKVKQEMKKENDSLLADIGAEEDALSSFDPYNTGDIVELQYLDQIQQILMSWNH
eukprot:CAMPEP_0174823304 /NCGR_PEP_ID=MMETSP1107-20130205/23327_1 /TAXON_ID=36770 /ORGANISM="Paraphysomonas vestita, Strain GFlagA" /LENGTH=257 /DNA_ID=CAMNT_0016045353 /DNA_START=164 /DNA_END=938 /DNA_ORIENTATION=+